MTQEALKQLIEDLISMMEYHVEQTRPIHTTTVALQAAREALKALAQPEQECWCTTCRPITMADMRFVVCPDCDNKRCPKANDHRNACTNSNEVGQKGSSWEHVKPLAQPEQEPVAKYSDIVSDGGLDPRNKFDTPPPQRTWVGLTDEDVNGFVGQYWGDEYMKMRSMVRAIEAKLKERNA